MHIHDLATASSALQASLRAARCPDRARESSVCKLATTAQPASQQQAAHKICLCLQFFQGQKRAAQEAVQQQDSGSGGGGLPLPSFSAPSLPSFSAPSLPGLPKLDGPKVPDIPSPGGLATGFLLLPGKHLMTLSV